MLRTVIVAAAFVLAPLPAIAQEAPSPAPTQAAKVKKICRYTPPRTGSNRPGNRICKTAEQWQEFDRATLDFDGMPQGTPARSQAIEPPSDN